MKNTIARSINSQINCALDCAVMSNDDNALSGKLFYQAVKGVIDSNSCFIVGLSPTRLI